MAQQKKTEDVDLPDDLPELSPEDELFTILIWQGISASDALRQAHKHTKEWEPQSVWVRASKLRNSAKVKIWLDALTRTQFNTAAYTLEEHIRELSEAQQLSKVSGNMGAMIQAIQLKGKATGHYTEKHEVTVDDAGNRAMLLAFSNVLGDEEAKALLGMDTSETSH